MKIFKSKNQGDFAVSNYPLFSFLVHTGRMWPLKAYLKLYYKLRTGKTLNLKNPTSFTEKLNWLKVYDRNPEYWKIVDKYEVKKIVKEKLGEGYLIPVLGVWNSFEDIDFEQLPNQFVLKCTHDSGGFAICKDKATFDKETAAMKLNKCLGRNYYWPGREWPYKNVKPRILAEPYVDSLGKPDSVEYKITCCNGEVKMITVCTGIPHVENNARKNDHFDKQWNQMDFYVDYKPSGKIIEKPEFMDEMVSLSEKLAKGLPTIRVDWYYINGEIIFGELTFYTHAGFMNYEPREWDDIMGSWLKLPPKRY